MFGHLPAVALQYLPLQNVFSTPGCLIFLHPWVQNAFWQAVIFFKKTLPSSIIQENGPFRCGKLPLCVPGTISDWRFLRTCLRHMHTLRLHADGVLQGSILLGNEITFCVEFFEKARHPSGSVIIHSRWKRSWVYLPPGDLGCSSPVTFQRGGRVRAVGCCLQWASLCSVFSVSLRIGYRDSHNPYCSMFYLPKQNLALMKVSGRSLRIDFLSLCWRSKFNEYSIWQNPISCIFMRVYFMRSQRPQ